jgi:hypothetical protein
LGFKLHAVGKRREVVRAAAAATELRQGKLVVLLWQPPSEVALGVIRMGRTPVDPLVPVVAQPMRVAGMKGGGGVVMVGTGGASIVPRVPTKGDTVAVGITGAELTPRLAISEEPSGMPVRGLPPGVVGAVDVGVVGDVAMLPELNPHKPDTPIVPIPAAVDIPEIGSNPGSSDVPAVWPLPDAEMVSDIVAVPAVAAVADPIAIPPPS